MRASQLAIATLREDPTDAEIASHRLLTRAGYIAKSGAGLYIYGPLLKRTLDKIARIVADEISAAGGLEITMPILQEQALWERSGRWATYQASRTMLTVKDRNDQVFGLAPTAEEVVTDYASGVVKSYRQLPVCFFQQHTKFRDEIRPRFGLMRVKEFIMMDAYSFHASDDCLDRTYQRMREAYQRAFRRMGLEAFAVEADSGAIGGTGSHEFMIAADVGEDTILFCQPSGYAANVERAVGRLAPAPAWAAPDMPTMVHTPDAGSIEDVVAFLNGHGHPQVRQQHLLKTVLYMARMAGDRPGRPAPHDLPLAACVRGDREVNEVKLQNMLTTWRGAMHGEVLQLRPMHPDEVRAFTGARPGFAGPTEPLLANIARQGGAVFLDRQLIEQPLVIGANRDDHHTVGWRFAATAASEDTPSAGVIWDVDITRFVTGDLDKSSCEPLHERRGIEVGHVFKLGTKYSAAMLARFTDQDGKLRPFIMGCYGIGTSRVAAAAVEQHHDADGIVWPMSIAPFQVVVVPAGKPGDAAVEETAQGVYQALLKQRIEAIIDDRELKPGPKFKDWDLIGIPLRIVVGRGVASGTVELKVRAGGAQADLPIAGAADEVAMRVRQALEGLGV